MNSTLTPEHEADRIDVVRRYHPLTFASDEILNSYCRLAALIFDAPFAAVTLVDEHEIWFLACHGSSVEKIKRAPGLCASAILSGDVYILNDALHEVGEARNELVHGEMGFRFFAAVPLSPAGGYNIGTLSVADRKPAFATEQQLAMLAEIGKLVEQQIETRLRALSSSERTRGQSTHLLAYGISH